MIERIQIENFKSIKNISLDLKPINIFIGANGAGKSNFISFLEMMNKITEKKLQSYIAENAGIDNLLYYGRKKSDYISGLLDFDNTNAYYFKLKPTQNNRAYFEKESDYYNYIADTNKNYQSWSKQIWGEGNEESLVIESDTYRANHVNRRLKNFKVYHFHDTGKNSKMKMMCMVGDNVELREDGGNLAAFLYLLKKKHPESFNLIESVIKSIAPFFNSFDLKPDRENEQNIQLEWKEAGSDMYMNAHRLSDGTLRMIALVTLLLQPVTPSTIIIDEPELGLHPFAIKKISALIKQASSNGQIIIATHSTTLIDNFEPEDIITVERKNGDTYFNRLNSNELEIWLEDYFIKKTI